MMRAKVSHLWLFKAVSEGIDAQESGAILTKLFFKFITFMITVAPCKHGLGCFSQRTIEAGKPITMMLGRRITSNYRSHPSFGVDAYYDNMLQVGESSYLILKDPVQRLNHSCDPNAGIRNNRLIALRRIAPSEEICFDYSTTVDEGGSWQMPCRCAALNCRGIIRDFIFLEEELQQHYLELGIVMPYIVRKYYSVTAVPQVVYAT